MRVVMQDLVEAYRQQRAASDPKLLIVPLKNTLQSLAGLANAEALCRLVRPTPLAGPSNFGTLCNLVQAASPAGLSNAEILCKLIHVTPLAGLPNAEMLCKLLHEMPHGCRAHLFGTILIFPANISLKVTDAQMAT